MSESFGEAAIVRRLKRGEPAALRLLFDRDSRACYDAISRIIKTKHEAEIVLSATFMEAWRTIDTFDATQNSLREWIVAKAEGAAGNYLVMTALLTPEPAAPPTHLNTTVKYESARYGVYWTTEAAAHVAENFADPTHAVTHNEVVQLLKRARFKLDISEETGRQNYFVFLTGRNNQVWETYVYLVPALNGWPQRCVIVTCYKSNKEQYRKLFAS